VNPFDDSPSLRAVNPLGKIPALILDNGETLFDSPVICRYLDSLPQHQRLLPQALEEQWPVLRWEALADGLLDAAYNIVMERRRPTNLQSATSVAQWSKDIDYALQDMEQRIKLLEAGTTISLAHLAAASAVGYLDFRLPGMLYAAECPQVAEYPRLQDWYERFKTRASMQATRPVE
jgi:glutathione S-transferase